MSANIFIIFSVEAQRWRMAQHVVHRLSCLFICFPRPFSKHFKQKSLRLANLQLRTLITDREGQKVGEKQ